MSKAKDKANKLALATGALLGGCLGCLVAANETGNKGCLVAAGVFAFATVPCALMSGVYMTAELEGYDDVDFI